MLLALAVNLSAGVAREHVHRWNSGRHSHVRHSCDPWRPQLREAAHACPLPESTVSADIDGKNIAQVVRVEFQEIRHDCMHLRRRALETNALLDWPVGIIFSRGGSRTAHDRRRVARDFSGYLDQDGFFEMFDTITRLMTRWAGGNHKRTDRTAPCPPSGKMDLS